MKIAIMQPYFFPYIGYFQLIAAVDLFVVYDNIQFSKKGWINRNRILVNGTDSFVSLPLRKQSDFLNVVDRSLSDNWINERKKIVNRIIESYRKAPYFSDAFPLIEKVIMYEDVNLFRFILSSLKLVNGYLEITTPIVISSTLPIDHSLKAQEKVVTLCKECKAATYINPIGGLELYDKEEFKREGIKLEFLKAHNIQYPQFNNEFVPFLSIIDVLMFNSKEQIRQYIQTSFSIQ